MVRTSKGGRQMSQVTQSNIGHSRGYNPLGRLSRRAKAAPVIAGAAVIALLTCAHSSVRAAEHPSRMVQVHHACAVVMGLHQPGDLYDTCVRSLDKSLSQLDQAHVQKAGSRGERALLQSAVTTDQ
jgi:hypothetical protein